jgi:hypothetical protein
MSPRSPVPHPGSHGSGTTDTVTVWRGGDIIGTAVLVVVYLGRAAGGGGWHQEVGWLALRADGVPLRAKPYRSRGWATRAIELQPPGTTPGASRADEQG